MFFGQGNIFFIILLIMMAFRRLSNPDMLYATFAFALPAVLISLTVHEFAHAFIADKLGDPTPRLTGRVTLDIRKHVDPFGLLIFLIAGFGWAKPVQTNSRYLKHPKWGTAFIAFAGPLINIIIAIITVIIIDKMKISHQGLDMLLNYIFIYNAGLAVFNLIPIFPLDGFHVFSAVLPNKFFYKFQNFCYTYEPYLMMVLLVGIYIGIFDKPIAYAITYIEIFGHMIASILPF